MATKSKKRSKTLEASAYAECVSRREHWRHKMETFSTPEEGELALHQHIAACNDCSEFS